MARVRLTTDAGECLEVTNNGEGFDSERVPLGSGLQSGHRLAALGGSLEVRSRPGKGPASWAGARRGPPALLSGHGKELQLRRCRDPARVFRTVLDK